MAPVLLAVPFCHGRRGHQLATRDLPARGAVHRGGACAHYGATRRHDRELMVMLHGARSVLDAGRTDERVNEIVRSCSLHAPSCASIMMPGMGSSVFGSFRIHFIESIIGP